MQFSPKKYLIILIFILTFFYLSAESLLVHKTGYFDIIYSKSSEKTAALIAEYADNYADEICSKLRKKILFRMPVFIAPNKDALNGYFTFFPYPQIAIFDTAPEDGILGNFSDSILKVFYHELTHAISLIYYLPVLPLSFSEGAAVMYESLDGVQGRLNDPLIYHHLMQGRIDGETPSWQEAAGHRDVYPGAFWGYIYGGAFADYLQKIYGMEKYAEYWHSSFSIFPQGKTKKIFNKSLKVLWNNFIASIYFPQDFMEPKPLRKKNNKSGFNITAANKNGFACFDFAKKEVVFYNSTGNGKKLFSANPTLSALSFSQDGKLLLVTDMILTLQGEKTRAFIFDMEKNEFLKKEYKSIRYASFCAEDMFCGVEVKGQFSELITVDVNSFEKTDSLFKAGPGLAYSALYNPVFAGKNKIAFIAANGINRDILIIDIVSKEIKKIEFKEPLTAIRYLQTNNSSDNPVLTFSWAEKNMLYRAALYAINTNELKVLEKDISGGVFFPVILPENESVKSKEIAYIGFHSKYNSIYKISEDAFTVKDSGLISFIPDAKEIKSKEPKPEILKPKKYNYISWMWRVFPVIYPVFSFNTIKAKVTGLAIDLYGNDPTNLFKFQTSSIFYFKPFFYHTQINLQINSSPVNFNVNFYDLNNSFIFRKTGASFNAGMNIPTKNINRNFSVQAGVSCDGFSFFTEKKKTLYEFKLGHPVFSEQAELGYSFLKTKYNLQRYFFTKEKIGTQINFGIKHGIHIPSKTNAGLAQIYAAFYTPLVPFSLKLSGYAGINACFVPQTGLYKFFNNYVFMGMGAYLPAMPEYQAVQKTGQNIGKSSLGFALDGELTVFSYEVQTGSSVLPIFYNRINFNLGYKNVVVFLDNGSGKYKPDFYQSIYGKFYATISGAANIGIVYAHPIEKVKFGQFDLLIKINF